MQEVQTDWHTTASKLTAAVRASDLSIPQIAKLAGVNYHCVYRINRDGVINQSQNALKLCKYFKIGDAAVPEKVTAADLKKAVVTNWDGTAEHARLIIELMRLAGNCRLVGKRDLRE